jgi:hypothetical protein
MTYTLGSSASQISGLGKFASLDKAVQPSGVKGLPWLAVTDIAQENQARKSKGVARKRGAFNFMVFPNIEI